MATSTFLSSAAPIRRYKSAKVRQIIEKLTSTTPPKPKRWKINAAPTSHNHSHANQGWPGMVKENMSW